jgi:hypothetical protein
MRCVGYKLPQYSKSLPENGRKLQIANSGKAGKELQSLDAGMAASVYERAGAKSPRPATPRRKPSAGGFGSY